MTAPMTDVRLAEIRSLSKTESEEWWALWCKESEVVFSIDDLQECLARLDAAEELLREVARSAVAFNFTRDNEILNAVEIDQDVLRKCRSYLR